MKLTLLILSLIAIAILLTLLYFNTLQSTADVESVRQAYKDSLESYAALQAKALLEVQQAKMEQVAQFRKDSVSKVRYKQEADRLRVGLKSAKTGRIDTLVDAEPQLRYYIAYYDSLTELQGLRIDSLEIQKRIQKQLCDSAIFKQQAYTQTVIDENQYLRGEVFKRDEIIEKQEKKLRKQKWWIRILGVANLAPRGGY